MLCTNKSIFTLPPSKIKNFSNFKNFIPLFHFYRVTLKSPYQPIDFFFIFFSTLFSFIWGEQAMGQIRCILVTYTTYTLYEKEFSKNLSQICVKTHVVFWEKRKHTQWNDFWLKESFSNKIKLGFLFPNSFFESCWCYC